MGSRSTHFSSVRNAKSRKSPRRPPKHTGTKPDWVKIAKRLARVMTEPAGDLSTDPMVLELDAEETIEARERIDTKLGLILSNAAVVAEMLRARNYGTDRDAASILDHHVIDALVEQMAEIGVLLGEPVKVQEQVEEDKGAGAS